MTHALKSSLLGVAVAAVVIVAALSTGVTSARSQVPTELPQDGVTSQRLGGESRFETSVSISQFQFPDSADRVFLARADEFADALSAGAVTGGPILLVPSCGEIPAVITDEITRLQPGEVIALGGEAAVCEQVLTDAVAAAEAEEGTEEPTPSETATTDPSESPNPSETPTEGNPFPFPTTLPSGSESPSPSPSPTTAS